VRTQIQVLFGERLSQLRAKQKWSQEDLSERAQIGIKHISSLENGHREPCLNTIAKLAEAFGITASQLIKGLEGHPLNDKKA